MLVQHNTTKLCTTKFAKYKCECCPICGNTYIRVCILITNRFTYYTAHILLLMKEERVKEECKYPTTHDPYKKRYVWRKIIENAHKEDEGNYSCVMDDGSANPPTKTQFIRVFGIFRIMLTLKKFTSTTCVEGSLHTCLKKYMIEISGDREYILNLSAEYKNITVNSGKTAKWVISIDSFPLNFTSVLRSNDGQKEIQATLTKIGGRRFKLEINRATLQYMGAYKLHVEHMYERKTLELYLTVKCM